MFQKKKTQRRLQRHEQNLAQELKPNRKQKKQTLLDGGTSMRTKALKQEKSF